MMDESVFYFPFIDVFTREDSTKRSSSFLHGMERLQSDCINQQFRMIGQMLAAGEVVVPSLDTS